MSIGPRNYIAQAQLMVGLADNPADAQASAEEAVAAINATLGTLQSTYPVSFSVEKEEGQIIFSEPG